MKRRRELHQIKNNQLNYRQVRYTSCFVTFESALRGWAFLERYLNKKYTFFYKGESITRLCLAGITVINSFHIYHQPLNITHNSIINFKIWHDYFILILSCLTVFRLSSCDRHTLPTIPKTYKCMVSRGDELATLA